MNDMRNSKARITITMTRREMMYASTDGTRLLVRIPTRGLAPMTTTSPRRIGAATLRVARMPRASPTKTASMRTVRATEGQALV